MGCACQVSTYDYSHDFIILIRMLLLLFFSHPALMFFILRSYIGKVRLVVACSFYCSLSLLYNVPSVSMPFLYVCSQFSCDTFGILWLCMCFAAQYI